MIIEMEKGASQKLIDGVVRKVRELGFDVQPNIGEKETVIAVLGSNTGEVDTQIFETLPGVKKVIRIMSPYKLASRDFSNKKTIVKINGVEIGGSNVVIMAGPCAVESEEQILACAKEVKKLGGQILRGGAFKPRTSPFAFQGLKLEGLKFLAKARKETGLIVVSEVVSVNDVPLVSEFVDILQIGARNMQNYSLLTAVAESKKPVLLKRGFAATIEEWLMAADYLLRGNGFNVILCERGVRTFDNSTRFTLDVGAIPVVKRLSHLPIIVDPSHAAGNFRYVPVLARAATAAGADGLIIEIHPDPQNALSDGAQSLTFSDFARLIGEIRIIAEAIGRKI